MPRSGSSGPRDRHRLTERDEWTYAVLEGNTRPRGFSDALAMAFTCATPDAIGQPEVLAMDAGEDQGGHMRAAYRRLGRELGMGRETLRLTIQGARWVTLPEIESALSSPVVGPLLRDRISEYLGLVPWVLHKDQDFGRGGQVGGRVGEGWVSHEPGDHRTEPDMEQIEQRIRTDVVALDRLIQRAARSGRPVQPPVDWAAIRRALDVPRVRATTGPGVGMAGRVHRAGVGNLAELIRAYLRDGGEVRTYLVRAAIQREHPGITADQIDSAFARLYRRGEVERLERGVYRATASLKPEGG